MAKRHHSGMKGFYEGSSDTRRMEGQDGSMLNDSKGSIANMPQDVKYHLWPSSRDYLNSNLDDTIRGIDSQISADHSKTVKHLNPKKV